MLPLLGGSQLHYMASQVRAISLIFIRSNRKQPVQLQRHNPPKSDFLKQAATFENTLKGSFYQSFQKIRGKKRRAGKSEVDDLLQERKRIRIEVQKTGNFEAKINLERVESSLGKLVSNKNRDRVNKILKSIANTDSSCNTIGMWKQIKIKSQKY